MAACVDAVRRHNVLPEWLAFFGQVLIAISVEAGDDLGRALVSQHGTEEGIKNAKSVVAFESAHGLWVEPAWQMFFQQTHHVLVVTVTWFEVARVMNGVYILGHIFVTLGVAAWVYFYRRPFFRLMRNTVILANVVALVIYERFPVAPPRLMPPLPFGHQMYAFQDTLYGVLNGGKFVGSSLSYNEFSAMPSVHIAWALIASAMVVALARPILVRALFAAYPFLMLAAVVVTGNHFVLDAAGGAGVVLFSSMIAVSFEWWRGNLRWWSPHRADLRPA